MNNSWNVHLTDLLLKKFGKSQGLKLAEKYAKAFPTSYHEQCTVNDALNDIVKMEKLSADNPLEVDFYEADKTEPYPLHLKLFQYDTPIPLSDILPMLENMDLRTYSERPYHISINNHQTIWISDFSVVHNTKSSINIDKIEDIFLDALLNIYRKTCENDGFNKLILSEGLSWREINIIRAYAKYLHQTGFRFNQAYIEKTIAQYPDITKNLITLFLTKFGAKQNSTTQKTLAQLDKTIQNNLEAVTSLDDDRILRHFWDVIKATLRTNYFQKDADGKPKDYISLKLKSAEVPELPLPHPLYEIFVYSTRFEGIHLRSEKVSRGGIRWSDRREDFRTEILGLMKAQKVKNAVIVPSGAKGGFVLKMLPAQAPRDIVQQEVIFCYKSFIRGLLDLTDNLRDKKTIPPVDVVCYDEPDPYLVVAADKGTASFSDIANSISHEYQFWLGDAFASGGSAGYDHKKMGITARGAWESVKRHFRELEIDLAKTDITVIGIGDMSGDVFGNGMIYSKKIKLVAAFDHRHIFIDPNPHPDKSYQERVRLFNLPASSWEDYDAKLISKGGGVFKRSSKSIALTAEIKNLLGIEDNSLTPNGLIRAVLRAPVDLLFNGGIGTYVKASGESQAEVGDKTNEFCRINGMELRCRVVGEGGNLGFTQLGRIEYALQGGMINTDFIDNSAGVDCSDHEVNIKILLDKEVQQKALTEKKRNQILVSMTDEVAQLVLQDNYNQALAMSFSAVHSAHYTTLYQNYIKELETAVHLDRAVEFLPDDKRLLERKAAGVGLTRPELAVLLAYTKIYIKNGLLASDLPEDPYFNCMLETAFPARLTKSYSKAMEQHRLRREIIATQLSNFMVNSVGITFVYRLQAETGASIAEIARAYVISANAFDTPRLQQLIDSLGCKITLKLQLELYHHIRQLLNLSTRWFLRGDRIKGDIQQIIGHYAKSISSLEAHVSRLMVGVTKEYMENIISNFVKAGLEEKVARKIAISRALYTALNVIEVATQNNFSLTVTAEVYFEIGSAFNLVWFRDQIANDSREGHWNTLARLALRDELDTLQRGISIVMMRSNKKEKNSRTLIHKWLEKHPRVRDRWEALLELLHGSTSLEYTMFFIALRELADLVLASKLD